MNRRNLLKSLGILGGSMVLPQLLSGQSIIKAANAANISQRSLINARATILGEIEYSIPSVMPQVINIFLYGGPSELAGNLTNIEDINANSQNAYNADLLPGANNTRVTANNFWSGAGGEIMERMVAKGRMSVYRTINREIDDSKAHRSSIFSNLTAMVGEDDLRPGIATNLAIVLAASNAIKEDAIFPFVTFEGESVVFNQGDSSLPLHLKPISLNRNLSNPYTRGNNSAFRTDSSQESIIEQLAQATMKSTQEKYGKVAAAFEKRIEIDEFVDRLEANLSTDALPNNPDFIDGSNDIDKRDQTLVYPNNGFGPRLKAAITLAQNNNDSLFISLGNEGLGGWDDHNSALDDYPPRMANLMRSLEVAAQHLEAIGKSNVVINVFGDFGRNVNLNNSLGWDHGNNQNLFTVSASSSAGAGIAGREMGKIVGKTKRIGTTKQNRQFTSPTDDSYQAEPFAIGSTIYKYFGIQNPEVLTGGIDPIDETGTPNEWVDPGIMS